MAQNTHIRETLAEIQATAKSEKEWWEQRKEEIRSGFMKELDEEKKPVNDALKQNPKIDTDDEAVIVESGGPASTPGKGKKKKGKH
jgi:translocation protein SEC66